jgi:FAD dependent oxidoreductase TIGR03364
VIDSKKVDVAVVGAGIVGLAHAHLAARSRQSVAIFERNPAALGASIRNFGMVWSIGHPADRWHEIALRSREIWLEVLQQSKLPYLQTGSLHATYWEDEAAAGKEFSERATSLGYECAWLTPDQTLARTHAIRSEGLLGALGSPTELTIDPPQIIRSLPQFLSDRFGVQVHFNSAVRRVESSLSHTADQRCEADAIIVASGDDFQALFASASAITV